MSMSNLTLLPLALGLGTSPSPEAMTLGEMQALTLQLVQCWALPILPKGKSDIAVDIDVTVNPDRTVARADIVDQARLTSDAAFRTMAEADLRAIRDPKCSPLGLPPDKYDQWKSMTIHFDPKEMLGQ
jgi:hypothetical protein